MRRSFGRASFFLLAACAFVAGSARACKEPTQVTIDIRTLGFKCSELKKVTVVVASDPQTAEEKWQYPKAEVGECQGDFEVGTLVITPSGDHGAVMVLASYTESPCVAPDYVNCIVARRQFSFIANVPLRLPITLEAACKNVPCNALSSCRSGTCVTSEADCNDNGTCAAPAEPVVAEDGGTIPPPADATLDIPPNEAFVPPDTGSDVVVPPTDSGSDVVADAGVDTGPDLIGNDCPTPGGPTDCFLQNKVCCAYMYNFCGSYPVDASPPEAGVDGGGMGTGTPPMPGCDFATSAPALYCTGRKHCTGNDYCCVGGGTANQMSRCAPGNCSEVLCNRDADCPPPLRCNGYKYPPFGDGGGGIKMCVP